MQELDFAADLGAEFFGESDDEDDHDHDDDDQLEVSEVIQQLTCYSCACVTLNAPIGSTICSTSDRMSDRFLFFFNFTNQPYTSIISVSPSQSPALQPTVVRRVCIA